MTIKKGSKIKVDYEGRLENGEVFDSSQHGDHSHPLEFEVGSGQVIKGFDEAVIGMNVGDEKEFTIPSKEAYGEHDSNAIRSFPREMFPSEELKEGVTLMLSTPEGQQFPAKVIKIEKDKISMDFNHPLAGKTLIFKIKILEIN